VTDFQATPPWQPTRRKLEFKHVMVRGPDLLEQHSYWGKVPHAPIHGWLDYSSHAPEDVDLLRPQPSEWREMTAAELGALDKKSAYESA